LFTLYSNGKCHGRSRSAGSAVAAVILRLEGIY
jgi:hypothetical protein